ncbi:hypothetical protein FBU30_004278 [Linnemannia zychae]|nr:hypothetical protein FBU30_004278 [Linnemannia zychae]
MRLRKGARGQKRGHSNRGGKSDSTKESLATSSASTTSATFTSTSSNSGASGSYIAPLRQAHKQQSNTQGSPRFKKQSANRKLFGERSSTNLSSSGVSGDSLVERIKRRRIGKSPATFRSLVNIAHAMHFGIYEELPESSSIEHDLSPMRQTLCRLSLTYLRNASNMATYASPENNLSLKDAFVSLSGAWNMFCQDANSAFKDYYKQGLDACAVKELDTADAGFAAIIAECLAKTDTGVKAQPIISKIYELQGAPDSEPYRRSLDDLKTILKHAEQPLSGRTKDASEGDAVCIWSAVFREQLPATACLALNLVEQGIAAARQSNLHLFRIFDIIAGTRKCDTILTVEGQISN